MDIPINVSTGMVTGRYIADIVDGIDAGSEPDVIAMRGSLVFMSSVEYLPVPTAIPDPLTIMRHPIVGVLDAEGYLCTPYPDSFEPQYRGIRLIATDDPNVAVKDWTWDVTYLFEPVGGKRSTIQPHGFSLPAGEPQDLTRLAKVPSSPGYSLPQAEAAALRAEGAASSSAQDAALAAESAERAEQAAGATDAGVAILLDDPGTVAGGLLEDKLKLKADTENVYELLVDKADKTALETKADTTALVAGLNGKVSKGDLWVNVKYYGANGNGVTDDTVAIQAAEAAAASGYGRPIYFPNGTYLFSHTLTTQSIVGENRQKTLLKYTGAGDAVGPGAGVMYHRRMEHLTVLGTGVGTGLNLDTSPAGSYVNMIVQGFALGINLDGTGASDALYNVFDDVTVQTTETGVRLDGLSHENRFKNFRINYAATGFDFVSGGRNVIESAAIENTTTGVIIRNDGSGGHTTRANVIANTRFEFNTTNIAIESGVEMTGLLFNRYIGGLLVDNGTYTMNADITTGTYKGAGVDVGTVNAGAVKAPAMYSQSSFADARIQFGISGTTIDRNRADSNPALRVNSINAGALGNIQEWQAASVLKARISASRHHVTRANAAPADSALVAGEAAYWFDSTNGAAKFMVKAKQADGTLTTGSIPLT